MIDPELHAFLDVWNEKWAALAPSAGPAERRAHFEVIAEQMRLPTPEDIDPDREIVIPNQAGDVRVRVFRYKDDQEQPCLIYMHGGAWMQGSPETHWDITSRIASMNRQTVVSIDYALAPEHPFPAAFNQCAAVVHWVFEHSEELGIDPQRIAIGGDSAGANLAAALAVALRGQEPKLIAQLLIYPAVDFEMERPAYTENADAPLLNVRGMPAVNAMYCPDPAQLRDPRAAPILAPDHTGLPPTYIAVAQNDPLRDDGIDYASKLEDAAVPVRLHRGDGLIHGYLRAMDYCAASRNAFADMVSWLGAQNRSATAARNA